MIILSSNEELLAYLLSLAGVLDEVGLKVEAEDIRFAARQGAGLSTEFLGESLLAMRRVSVAVHRALGSEQIADFGRVEQQLAFALKR